MSHCIHRRCGHRARRLPQAGCQNDGHQLTEHELNSIKKHLFENRHLLKDYVTGEMYYARFDSDARQAAAWGRFELGTATDLDRLMLQHELAELRYLERNPGAPYREAHDAANIIADWNTAWRATHARG